MSFEEEQLPVSLDKLEISPTIPQIKFNDSQISMSLNPFFNNNNNNTEPCPESFQNAKSRIVHRRRLRFRRRSESYLDECKESPSNNLEHLDVSVHNTRCQHMPRIQKPSLKKSTAGNTKRSVLREPVLRCLHTSMHSKCIGRRSLQNSSEEDKLNNSHSTTKTQGICNFRELINECHNLIEHDSDLKGRFSSTKINCPLSKSFTTLQSKESNAACNSTALVADSNIGSVSVNDNGSSTTITTTGSIKTINEPIIRSSTSCSQQASNSNGTNNCGDITINELASYFETMVHIPKKMSSMAEMMYI